MNWRKHLLSKLAMGVTIVGILSTSCVSHATITSPGKYLKMDNPTYRNSGYAYQVGIETENHGTKENLHMWKIYEYNSDQYNVKQTNTNSTFYCLRMGVGFGSANGSDTHGRNYTKYADMKKPANGTDEGIINAYKQTLANNKEENYNSLVWLLDHCYVPTKQAEETAKEYKQQLLTNAHIPQTSILFNETYKEISDDLIDIVQQLAIWHFTNANSEYDTDILTAVQISEKEKAANHYQDIGDFFDGKSDIHGDASWELLDELDQLYTYLIDAAEKNKSTSSSLTATNPIHLTKDSAKLEKKQSNGKTYYIAGPYTITENNANIVYTIEGKLTGSDNANIEYKLLNKNRTEQSDLTLANLAKSGEQFYLKIEETQGTSIDKVKFQITTKVKQNTLTYWEVNDNQSNNEQPVVEIVPEEKQFKEESELTLSEFDLALRKFITKINGVDVKPSRVPNVQPNTITGSVTTATKEHTKTPIQVKEGDTVLYTIRIYNEGDINGYASKVVDYLPEGLELLEPSEINTTNGWQKESDGKTIYSTNLANQLIEAFNGSEVKYKDLQVECKVVAKDSTTKQSLKNVAEITEAKDENHNDVVDRDSTPNNLGDKKNNYNPDNPTKGKGYEDDDDYEELVLTDKYFDLALRKFITKINNQNVESREPQITEQTLKDLKEGKTNTVTKTHTKDPLEVKLGDIVTYTIRIYNEGELDGYASQVTDYLPAGLTLKTESDINTKYGWQASGDGRTITTNKLQDVLLPKFNSTEEVQNSSSSGIEVKKLTQGQNSIYYVDLEIECVVTANVLETTQSFKNVAEITEAKDKSNQPVQDRDSVPKNLPEDKKGDNYKPGHSTDGWGYEDDDDYEELVIPGRYFDLALRKFITKVIAPNATAEETPNVTPSREPEITEQTLKDLKDGNIDTVTKTHTKEPIEVNTGDTIIYTIRIYNEGELDGYASEVTDLLPEGLEFVRESDINNQYGWVVSEDGKTITTDKLKDVLIPSFNGTEKAGDDSVIKVQKIQKGGNTIYYVDLQIECKVVASVSQVAKSMKNVAEITKAEDENHQSITDRDSKPKDLTDDQKNNYHPEDSEKGWGYEDDDDYEELVMPGRSIDLALRKFITQINDKEFKKEDGSYTREPVIDLSPLQNKTGTTAIYKHPKDPIGVSVGDIVIYTLRIYNEGEISGYASSVTDYLPPQLQFVMNDEEQFNAQYGWIVDSSLRKATTHFLERDEIDPEDNLIEAFDGTTLHYKDLKIKCKVISTENLDKVITNIAEITDFTSESGEKMTDRDSTPDSLTKDNSKPEDQIPNDQLPSDSDLPDYKGNDSNKSVLTDENYFYKGQQDDDDFEKLILEEFDLALRKFITKVNDTPVTNRVPVFTNVKDENGNYIYEHTKEPIEVDSTDLVEYTLRIYNEGDIAGYAKEVKDDIPNGLEFLPENDTNKEYRWVMLDENGNETDDVTKAVSITTDYLSKEQEKESGENLIEAFDSTRTTPDYKEVKVVFKVVAFNTYEGIITNIAEISDDADEEGNPVEDKDSTPDNNEEKEDDIDKEHVKLSYFDLALRKFITGVNQEEVTNRIPQFKVTEDGNYTYEHTKEPVEVQNGDFVTYTLRVYNEGTKDGYAKEVKDDLPDGLEFLPENETNKEYRWVMLDEDGNETDDITKAVSVKTDYLSKEQEDATGRDNLLKKFDIETMEEPDHRDIKIVFKVTEPNTSDRILINKAQISNDSDKDGNDVVDKDSTPDKWIEEEDDQDTEKVKVKYFDLALRKWVTEAIVIENGKETVTPTGHKAEDNPEEVVKVEIKESQLGKVVVKFRYKIRVTNEGEIAGYAEEISDYIPEGLKFVATDNPKWKEVDGKIVTDQLKDTLLQPGESAEVEVLLTWINGKNNLGLKVNVAEISKDKNDSNTPDIDSTPNNQKPKEDDIDDAPVILSVKTGVENTITYVTLTGIILGILSTGLIFIKKYVLF